MDILYTTTDQVRGCLFTSVDDLPDSLFNSTLLVRELTLDLDKWLPTHATLVVDTSTSSATRISNLIKSYATYWLAFTLADTLPVSLPKTIGDGKVTREVIPDAVTLRESILARLSSIKAEIRQLVSGTSSSAMYPWSISPQAVDPVTYDGA